MLWLAVGYSESSVVLGANGDGGADDEAGVASTTPARAGRDGVAPQGQETESQPPDQWKMGIERRNILPKHCGSWNSVLAKAEWSINRLETDAASAFHPRLPLICCFFVSNPTRLPPRKETL